MEPIRAMTHQYLLLLFSNDYLRFVRSISGICISIDVVSLLHGDEGPLARYRSEALKAVDESKLPALFCRPKRSRDYSIHVQIHLNLQITTKYVKRRVQVRVNYQSVLVLGLRWGRHHTVLMSGVGNVDNEVTYRVLPCREIYTHIRPSTSIWA